jgi:hypothetical protein
MKRDVPKHPIGWREDWTLPEIVARLKLIDPEWHHDLNAGFTILARHALRERWGRELKAQH